MWAQRAVGWVPKVIVTPHSGDVMAESVSFNIKSSLPGFAWRLQARYIWAIHPSLPMVLSLMFASCEPDVLTQAG